MVDTKCCEQETAGKTEQQLHGRQGAAPSSRDTVSLRGCCAGCGAGLAALILLMAPLPGGSFLNLSFLLVEVFSYIYSKLALLLFKAIASCNTSSLVSLKGWQTLREERKEL